MTKETFIEGLTRFAALAAGLPLTESLLTQTAERLKGGDPAWWRNISSVWEKRAFAHAGEAAGLYLTALHYEALRDAAGPLAPNFPSCGGAPGENLPLDLGKFLNAPPRSFFDNLRDRSRRFYLDSLSALWMGPALHYFQHKRAMPFYLVDIETGAGLTLAADVLAGEPSFDSGLVAARIGLDRNPIDPTWLDDHRWLTASIAPDSTDLIARLDASVAALKEQLSADPDFIQVVPVEPAGAAEFIARSIPADDPAVGLLVTNSFVTSRMNDPEYAAYAASLSKTLAKWGDRGLWVEIENSREADEAKTVQLRLHRFTGGALRSLVMAQVEDADDFADHNQETEKFLETA